MTSIGLGVPGMSDNQRRSKSPSPMSARPLAGTSPLDDPERLSRMVAGSSTNKAMSGLPGKPLAALAPASAPEPEGRSKSRARSPVPDSAQEDSRQSPFARKTDRSTANTLGDDLRGRGGFGGEMRSLSPNPLGSAHASTSVGPGLGALPTESKKRSQSPMPLGDPAGLHSTTSVGPGLGALSRDSRKRSQSPMPLGDPVGLHSSTSVGPGLGGLSNDAKKRAQSPMPLTGQEALHASTSVGPGLRGFPKGGQLSPAPPTGDPAGLHSSTSVGLGLGAMSKDARGRSRSPMPLDRDSGAHPSTSVGPGLSGLRGKSPAPLDTMDGSGSLSIDRDKKKKKNDKTEKREAQDFESESGPVPQSDWGSERSSRGRQPAFSNTNVGPGLAALSPLAADNGKKDKKDKKEKKHKKQRRGGDDLFDSPASSRPPSVSPSPSSRGSFNAGQTRLLDDCLDDDFSSEIDDIDFSSTGKKKQDEQKGGKGEETQERLEKGWRLV